ncbi:MAG: DUF692 family protein [Rickettsiales bacterium]|nr:DUF692 family protein [Rickettsiales bacterium]
MTQTLPHLGYGLGLRSQHWDDVLNDKSKKVEWFEVISENFMTNYGYAREVLGKIRQDYPVVMHGVSLSIGSSDPVNETYLTHLKALADWLEPAWISDHVCWTGNAHINTHDLLPVPYTEDALKQMVEKVGQVQEFLGRRILLENPSNYMEFAANTLSEWEFIAELLKQADCMLLLDINNVYVTCYNHRLDPKVYIDAIPAERIGQIHLAGHENHGTHLIDTHDAPVNDEVLALYAYAMRTKGMKSTMIEWDSNIPDFSAMLAELDKVKQFAETENLPNFAQQRPVLTGEHNQSYEILMDTFQACILERAEPSDWVREKDEFPAKAQMNVYQLAYRKRLFDTIVQDYPQTREEMGEEAFDILVRTYIERNPSQFYALEPYIRNFVPFLKEQAADYAATAALEVLTGSLQEYPQPEALSLEALGQTPPDQFLHLNLSLTPAAKLLPNFALICQKLEVFRQPLEGNDYHVLKAIHETETLEAALQRLYEHDICTAENVLPTLQQALVDFVPKGFFIQN